jgi:hypothetical protein
VKPQIQSSSLVPLWLNKTADIDHLLAILIVSILLIKNIFGYLPYILVFQIFAEMLFELLYLQVELTVHIVELICFMDRFLSLFLNRHDIIEA